jgi:hypothetical protein
MALHHKCHPSSRSDRPRVTLTFHPNGCFCGQHSEPRVELSGAARFRNVLYAPPVRSSARTSPAR